MHIKPHIILALLVLTLSSAYAGQTIEDFEGYSVGKFPSAWRTWPFQRGKASIVYKVMVENENKYLSGDDSKDLSIQILKDLSWDIKEYPILTWRWRAKVLPAGANETSPVTNDSACGVYVVLSKARGEMLKYAWSTTVPVGTVYEKKTDKAYIIIAESGGAHLGIWQSQKINVSDDYKKYFHHEPNKNPIAIAILTDGNATHTRAACDYDDFVLEGTNP